MNELVLSNDFNIPSKNEIAMQVERIANQVFEGEIDPLRAYGLLTALEKVCADTKKVIVDEVISEKEKYPEKQTSIYGATFEVSECGVRYDYSSNPAWCELQEQIDIIKAEQKGLEKTLQLSKMCSRTSTTTVKCTLNK